jgi:hypothetical protein
VGRLVSAPIVHPTHYTAGQDHEGTWWIIAPNGDTGYPVTSPLPEHVTPARIVNRCNVDGTTPVAYGLESADPPPELVGGPGLDDEVYVSTPQPCDDCGSVYDCDCALVITDEGHTEPTRVEALIEGDPARPDRLLAQRAAKARETYWTEIGRPDRANASPSMESLLAWCRVVAVIDRG